jgi:hypothetical protein
MVLDIPKEEVILGVIRWQIIKNMALVEDLLRERGVALHRLSAKNMKHCYGVLPK